jgi:hypothetical protein
LDLLVGHPEIGEMRDGKGDFLDIFAKLILSAALNKHVVVEYWRTQRIDVFDGIIPHVSVDALYLSGSFPTYA